MVRRRRVVACTDRGTAARKHHALEMSCVFRAKSDNENECGCSPAQQQNESDPQDFK